MVHLQGDASIVRGPIRPMPDVFGYDEDSLSAEDRVRVRERAFKALCDYRERGCTLPPAPDRATVREIINFIGGEPPPPGNEEMLEEELDLDCADLRATVVGGWTR